METSFQFGTDGFQATGVFMALFGLFTVAVHVAFAIGVYNAGTALERRGHNTEIVSPLWWAAAALLMGVVGAILFWGIHFSPLLRRRRKPATTETRREALRERRRGLEG